jgi:hypothetical protein
MQKELKFARRWLYSKGVMVPEEDKNPVDQQMIEFWDCIRTGAKPKANLEIGLSDSAAVILSNLSMKEERRVWRKEIDTLGNPDAKPAAPAKKG